MQRAPVWLVVAVSVVLTLVTQQMVAWAALSFSPPGPARLDDDLQSRIDEHFKSLGFEDPGGGSNLSGVGANHAALALTRVAPVEPDGPGEPGRLHRRPNDAEELFNAISSTDRFMRREGFLPCPAGILVLPAFAVGYGRPDGRAALFSSQSGVAMPSPRKFVVSEPGSTGVRSLGDTATVVLLRYRLRQIHEAECSIVLLLDRLQGRLGAAFALDGQRNGLWGRLGFRTSSFSLRLEAERVGSEASSYAP